MRLDRVPAQPFGALVDRPILPNNDAAGGTEPVGTKFVPGPRIDKALYDVISVSVPRRV